MEKNSLKKDVVTSSSAWLSAFLNFFPGLGVGYIYQHRWKAYWATTITSTIWIFLCFYNQLGEDPSDPLQTNSDMNTFIGLFLIASITAIEAWLAAKKAP